VTNRVPDEVPGEASSTPPPNPEDLVDLVAGGEISIDTLRKVEADLRKTEEAITARRVECRQLIDSTKILPRYLDLFDRGCAEKSTLNPSVRWMPVGTPGKVVRHPMKKIIGLVIAIPGKDIFICRFGENIERLENLGHLGRRGKEGYYAMPDRTGPNADYLELEFAEIGDVELPPG
ncbi:MAG: hypothetical protein WC604_03330, partial [Candidatus Gracilibacteria bacterium]